MADSYKPNLTTGFTAGEFSPALAGRVDLDDYKYSARLIENFIPEIQGGLKKFYGTRHIATIQKPNDYIFVPFNGADDPIVLVFHDGIISVICADTYYDTDVKHPVVECSKLRWAQMNDVIYFAHPNCKPFTIELLGKNTETQRYEFGKGDVEFEEEPFFPLGWRGNYGYEKGHAILTTGYNTSGDINDVREITVETKTKGTRQIKMKLPATLKGIVGSQNVLVESGEGTMVLSAGTTKVPVNYTLGTTTLQLLQRDASGTVSVVQSQQVGSTSTYTLGLVDDIVVPTPSTQMASSSTSGGTSVSSVGVRPGGSTRPGYVPGGGTSVSGGSIENIYVAAVSKTVSNSDILNLLGLQFSDAKFVGDDIVFTPGAADEDKSFAIKIIQTASTSEETTPLFYSDVGNGTYTVRNSYEGYEQQGDFASLEGDPFEEFKDTDVEGRYIKFLVQYSSTGVAAWAQGIVVTENQIVYSDSSYYRAVSGGTTGAIQPTHKYGTRSDGQIMWEYMHSGTGIAKITKVIDDHTLKASVIGNLPITKIDGNTAAGEFKYEFPNFQWSIFGYKGRYPDQVFFFKGRLGYFTSTIGFGCWVTMSKVDEFTNFGTETYGINLDTDGITSIITGHSDNNINWLMTGERLYCGSYAGEYAIMGAKDGTLTPINYNCTAISSLGGAKIPAMKFKELNLFVGTLSDEIYTISYDYTTDDYVPTNIGFMSTHLLDQYIYHWYALNNNDRNIYFLTEASQVNILNYVKEMKTLGYYRLNLNGECLEIGCSNAGVVSAMYFLIKRGDTYTIERDEHDFMSYVICRKSFLQEEPADIQIREFAKQKVYVFDMDTGMFYHAMSEDDGTIKNRGFKNFFVGLPMYCTLHCQPMTGEKLEGLQQKAIAFNIRLRNSGAFEWGTSHDFNLWHEYHKWNTQAGQQFGEPHKLMTGDIRVPTPAGYMQAANKADGPYPNDTGVALNLRCETPEPFNLLMVSNVYV